MSASWSSTTPALATEPRHVLLAAIVCAVWGPCQGCEDAGRERAPADTRQVRLDLESQPIQVPCIVFKGFQGLSYAVHPRLWWSRSLLTFARVEGARHLA